MRAKVVVLPGDGIGPEVMGVAVRVMEAAATVSGAGIETRTFRSGWQLHAEKGAMWEDGAFEACRDWADAVLHGAVGWPGARPEGWSPADGSVVLDLRYGLELYANVRPVRLLPGVPVLLGGRPVDVWRPGEVDIVIVRENLEDLYLGARRTPFPARGSKVQVDERRTTRDGSRRVIIHAFEEAERRARGDHGSSGSNDRGPPSVACVDKSNVLPGCALFRQVFDEVAAGYGDIVTRRLYADAFLVTLLRAPWDWDVVVTPNLIGDMVTDLAAVLQGGLGMAPSANIGDGKAMFEPVHGSAPDIAGKGLANPTGMVLSVGMMFEWLGRRTGDGAFTMASYAVNRAVERHYLETDMRTADLGGTAGTGEVGDSILGFVR